jgi:hypothetical protein
MCLAVGALGSCGYQVGGLYDTKEVHIQIFDNVSERRTQEFDLTANISHVLTSRGIRVNTAGAPFRLEGKILDMRTPVAVLGLDNTVIVGSLTLRLEIRLVDASGREVWKDVRTESATFTQARGETQETARQQVFDKLSRWVLTHFEKEW